MHRVAIIREGRLVTVDTVDGLRQQSPRTIELRFRSRVDTTRLAALPGVALLARRADTVTLTADGPLGPLLRVAADLGVDDIVARPADLDELFRRYYQADTRQEAGNGH